MDAINNFMDETNVDEDIFDDNREDNMMEDDDIIKEDDTVFFNTDEPEKYAFTMKERLEKVKPYNIFYNRIIASAETYRRYNSIAFSDLLCPSLGVLVNSLHINFLVDIDWLMTQYEIHGLGTCSKTSRCIIDVGFSEKPLTLVYGFDTIEDMDEYMDIEYKNVEHYFIKQKNDFGIHHPKVGILLYEDGSLRIIVSSANLYFPDWNCYNNCIWVSPACPKMNDSEPDHSCLGVTRFKVHLINYLKSYNLNILNDWIHLVKRTDFSQIRVCLVTSLRGSYYPNEAGSHLHTVGKLLSRHCELPENTDPLEWSVIVQSSSLGSYGYNFNHWLGNLLLRSLASHTKEILPSSSLCDVKIIFPSMNNVDKNYFGKKGGGCLSYPHRVCIRQKWTNFYLHEWKAEKTGRTRAMPHCKTYCRVSPCHTKLAWFLLTSANASKAAWGDRINGDGSCDLRNIEVGVLFLPKYFDEELFTISTEENSVQLFPLIYDLPLIQYTSDNIPYTK